MAVFGRLSRSLGVVWTQIARVLTAIFGSVQWRAPLWLNRLLASLGVAIHHLRSVMREKPRQSAGVIALSVLVVAGAFAGWRWYQAQPKPQQVDIEIVAPTRTCYECDPPGSPQALLLKFSESAAPLDAVGKPLSIHLPRLQPQHPGQWRWQDDRALAFDPAQDWPVGQRFEIKLAKRGLIAEFLRLTRTDLEFSSAAFTAEVQNAEFHQDPLVAADKKAVLRLRFSHAVDARDLEKRITLKLFDKVADDKERDLGAVAFRVSYDKLGLEADISTEALKVPDKEGRLVFEIERGLRAARGGNPSPDMLTAEVKIPGLDSLAVKELKLDLARDDNEDPQQVAIVEFNFPVAQQDLPTRLKAWLLPLAHPDPRIQEAFAESNPGQPYDWTQGVDSRVIDTASPLPLETMVGDRDNSELQSFRYRAAPGRYAYVRLERGLSSFGGYRLGQTQERVLRVPEYPRELRVVAPGSLLAMSGPKQLNIVSRDVPTMKVEVSRLLPRQLQHLVSQTRGDFSKPEFNGWSLNEDNLSERFSKTERLAALEPGKAAYSALDLAPYLKDEAGDRRGIFLLKLEAWDAETNRAVSTQQVNEWGNSFDAPVVDTRLIVVTDLGLLVKRNLDGSSDVFVQSIHSGEPVDSVRVEVIGRNGLPVLEQTTDAQGHTRFPALKDFVREQQPVMLLARKDGDTSFLPLDYRLRDLDLSRFDVGGIANNADRAALSAYLFSDRGVYRPGEEIRLGAIVRTQDWRALPQGLPLQLEVTDPRGQIVRREKLSLSDNGFEDIRHATKIASPTGTWTFSLMVVRDRNRRDLVGSVTVLVREFEPDRLKMRVSLSQQRESGWVAPEQLKARIDLQNLFGAPAESRRVTATLRLSPSLPKFSAYPDYSFSDPQAAREGFNEELVRPGPMRRARRKSICVCSALPRPRTVCSWSRKASRHRAVAALRPMSRSWCRACPSWSAPRPMAI
ncbi:MAG: MG2 domain-containing protein [Panacagrimonas sp.]